MKYIGFLFLLLLSGCSFKKTGHEKMVAMLSELNKKNRTYNNFFCPEAKVAYYDSLLLTPAPADQLVTFRYQRAYFLLQAGEPEQAIEVYESLLAKADTTNHEAVRLIKTHLALAYLRLGELANCWTNQGSESCILPIQGSGIHHEDYGARHAIKLYEDALQDDANDLESRWLLNLAYMNVGEYPEKVPEKFLIPGLKDNSSSYVKPFQEIASDLGLNVHGMSGGSILEDFDRDGFLDIAVSSWALDEPMHYFRNNGDGTFADNSERSNLKSMTGGLNMLQADYNNDQYPDILVLRGAWMGKFGEQPNSLLKNNGDGTFTDVTIESGILSFNPTQTATWNDFNNDGWIDLFIGNESREFPHPCELFINQKDGTFKNEASLSSADIIDFVKGVTSGDYDNDGWKDIFISTMNNKSYLLRNTGLSPKGNVVFDDVTTKAGLSNHRGKTFPTWFWDYNNDGWLDIFLCSYEFQKSLGYYEAAALLKMPQDTAMMMKLFRNNGDGTFTNVAGETNMAKIVNAMGANFGDIDNDGYLDAYLGTGNPDSKSVVPNKLFRNIDGKSFEDVTTAARVGHLQKGHGVSFGDVDNDGDQDIHMEVGGSFKGDSYQNSFYVNPGYDHNWISIELKGIKSNSFGVGSRVKITFTDNGHVRTIFHDVNSGGSFGGSPLRCEIGLNTATEISEIEIKWHGSKLIQTFKNIKPNQFLRITEGSDQPEVLSKKRINFPTKVDLQMKM